MGRQESVRLVNKVVVAGLVRESGVLGPAGNHKGRIVGVYKIRLVGVLA